MQSLTRRKWQKREVWLCGILMCLGALAFHAFYFNSVLPVSEGWGIYYIELIKRGQLPYRDFYYYLPPLNLLVDGLFWNLSFGNMLVFRGWYLLQRLFIVVLTYKLLTKWFPPRYTWIACLTGMCFSTLSEYDLVGDYNQTTVLLIVVLTYMLALFLEKDADAFPKKLFNYKYIFASGIIISLMLLLKQSAGLAAIVICFLFLCVYCIVFKDKCILQYCLATAVGALIPIIVLLAYLFGTNSFFSFFQQFFGAAGAKGGIAKILLVVFSKMNFNRIYLRVFICVVLFGELLRDRWKHATKRFPWSLCAVGVLLIQTLLDVIPYKAVIRGELFNKGIFLLVGITLVLLAFGICGIRCKRLNAFKKYNFVLPTVLAFAATFIVFYFNVDNINAGFFGKSEVFFTLNRLVNHMVMYGIIYGMVRLFVGYAKNKRIAYAKPLMALFLCAIVSFYECSMAAGGSNYVPRLMATAMPLLLVCLFAYKLPKTNWNKIKNIAICFVCVLLCGVCMSQKYMGAYYWFGSERQYTLDERTERVEIDALKGFVLSEQKRLEYEQVTKLIEENSDVNDTVWGFPHVKIFNIITDRYNLEDPIPVPFYDVSSNEAARIECEWLKKERPEIVIWCDVPDCLEKHERFFQSGEKLTHREIIKWFSSAKDTEYTYIGQVGNLFVYKYNDGTPINYTFFQNPEAVNVTACLEADDGVLRRDNNETETG